MTISHALQPFGETIFVEMTRLANRHQAINLGQGFPNFDGPEFIKDAAMDAMRAGHNQYARSHGIPQLNTAIARHFAASSGLSVDPDAEITVTNGCTEAIAATMLGLLNPGDEVVVFEPFYDSYRACIALAGAIPRFVTLHAPDFHFDEEELRGAFSPKTRMLLLNTPHNPTGKVFTREDLEFIAALCREHDVIAVSDEVYEHLVFEGEHMHLAALPEMRQRTITLSSLGKTFSFTGWKIGWAIAPPELSQGIRAAHQFLTYSTATPLQHAAAVALGADQAYYDEFHLAYLRRRDILVSGLQEIGFRVAAPAGTYFVLADHTPFGIGDDIAFCRHLVEQVGVAAIPPSAFYARSDEGKRLVRFAFCKDEPMLHQAIERMKKLVVGQDLS